MSGVQDHILEDRGLDSPAVGTIYGMQSCHHNLAVAADDRDV